ncbi:MAG: hypothetical protein AAGC65_05705 [Mucilaginibacter sp.]|uniref:hypothetical protein n=1 Tax=Mucilaginibacter sp. TaxID=1882438 RepID=UPI0031A23F8D
MEVFNQSFDFNPVPAAKHLTWWAPWGVTVINDNDADSVRIMTLPTCGDDVKLINGQQLHDHQTSPKKIPKAPENVMSRL